MTFINISGAIVMFVLLVGCKTTSEMSYGELREFVRVTAERCDKEFGTKTKEDREACVLHEARKHNISTVRRKQALSEAGDALIAASAARRPITCYSSGGITNCY